MLKTILIAISMLMTIGIYYPTFQRIRKRKHTRDFSKVAQWFVTLVQINNLFLAVAEKAPYLTLWYCLQTFLCVGQLWLIYHYWHAPEPRHVIPGPSDIMGPMASSKDYGEMRKENGSVSDDQRIFSVFS